MNRSREFLLPLLAPGPVVLIILFLLLCLCPSYGMMLAQKHASDIRLADPRDIVGPNVDPNLPAHKPDYVLPANACDELKKIAEPVLWHKISRTDQQTLEDLMATGDMDKANTLAKILYKGAIHYQDHDVRYVYAGPALDGLVHSPLWLRIFPREKMVLASLLSEGKLDAARRYAQGLKLAAESRASAASAKLTSGKAGKMAEIARAWEWNKQWSLEADNGKFKRGSNKCNEFVNDVANQAGLDVPALGGWKCYLRMGGPPAARQWADPNLKIGCWKVVKDGSVQPGDVIAEITGGSQHPDWGHVGIVVGDHQTASAYTLVYPVGMITINNWGFTDQDLKLRVVRRCE